jgi:hypothetical protein
LAGEQLGLRDAVAACQLEHDATGVLAGWKPMAFKRYRYSAGKRMLRILLRQGHETALVELVREIRQ